MAKMRNVARCLAGAAAVLMLVQVQVLAVDQRLGFAGAAAV